MLIFSNTEEITRWWEVLAAALKDRDKSATPERATSNAVDSADAAVKAFRARFSPDRSLTPAESEAMADFNYAFSPEHEVWIRKIRNDQGAIYQILDAFTGQWCCSFDPLHPSVQQQRRLIKEARWDRSMRLRDFLVEAHS